MIRLALVDDHLLVRSGFAQLLSLEADMRVVAQFASVPEALKGFLPDMADVCLLDLSLPPESGLTLLGRLPDGVKALILSVQDSPAMVEKALHLGGRGFISKRCQVEELLLAIRTIAAGGCYLPPALAANLLAPRQGLVCLTPREREVCELLAEGCDVRTVALRLGLSHKTVHVHRAHALDKLNVSNNVELAHRMQREG